MKVMLKQLLASLKGHGWFRECPVCNKDCARTAIVDLVYVHENCKCSFAPYAHLVKRVYHKKCVGGIFK